MAKMPRRSLIEQLDDAVQGLIRNPGAPLPRGDTGVSPLVRIATELRDLPREDFKIRLSHDLERSISMATMTAPITATRTFAAPRRFCGRTIFWLTLKCSRAISSASSRRGLA